MLKSVPAVIVSGSRDCSASKLLLEEDNNDSGLLSWEHLS